MSIISIRPDGQYDDVYVRLDQISAISGLYKYDGGPTSHKRCSYSIHLVGVATPLSISLPDDTSWSEKGMSYVVASESKQKVFEAEYKKVLSAWLSHHEHIF